MKKILFLLLLLALPAVVVGQIPTSQNIIFVSTSPTGSCTNGAAVEIVISTGAIFTCQAGTWGEVGVDPDDGFPIVLGTTAIVSGSTTTTLAGITIDGVTPTTFGFIDPTSSIQTQLNSKLPTASFTFDNLGSGTNVGHGLVCGNGCVSTTAGTGVINANEISGVLLSGLATGILKNTAGVPSIATPGTDYVVPSGNITGTAAGLSGTPTLPNGTLAQTSAITTNSTLIATTAAVTTALAAYTPTASLGLPVSGGLTLTTATTDTATIAGVTSSSHCVFSPTNATAAAITVLGFISSVSANTVVFSHAATVALGGTINIVCTVN